MYTSKVIDDVQQDINQWIQDFVEAPNPYYGEKFPVCPYARQARLAGQSSVKVYESGSVKKFIETTAYDLAKDRIHQVCLMVLPPRVKYYPGIYRFIYDLDKKLVALDLYALGGLAVGTRSRYPGWFNQGEYFVVGINTLSNVLPAVEHLKAKGYYLTWSKKHYQAVVQRRQKLYEKYGKTGQ